MNAINKENSKVFLLILLGMLSAFGPFVTDMYLPSLPAMADYFSASLPMVQMGLTTSMIGLALGQIFFGPLSDKYGRRPLLLVSMLLFIVSTLFCLFAPDIYSFVTLRLIQGIAGAGGIVISRSVATDKFSGKELAKMLAVIGAINGVAPVAAPVIGGLLTGSVGWQGIFMILLFIGILLGIGCIRFKESFRPRDVRRQVYGQRSAVSVLSFTTAVIYFMYSNWLSHRESCLPISLLLPLSFSSITGFLLLSSASALR